MDTLTTYSHTNPDGSVVEVKVGGSFTVGDNVTIGHNVWFKDDVHIGNDVVIGNGCEFMEVVIGDFSKIGFDTQLAWVKIGHHTVLEGSVGMDTNITVGNNVVIGWSCDMGPHSTIEDGVVIGKNFQAGGNVTLGKNSRIGNFVTLENDIVVGQNVTIDSHVKLASGQTIKTGQRVDTHYTPKQEQRPRRLLAWLSRG